ncbi:hypothetical protein B0J11DRAFT_429139 [Dendryphion nanum]|uniref:Uncharacterized protein n=1 Tax=Dendryphion nanum TaxID=256645 RepID=A0A9P9IPU3_9PLEO|nr:hypothetical protein B0J11DRAFT_429139 [Dendryphion nanum]
MFFTSFLLALASFQIGSALPLNDHEVEFPEVIPGEGLPSLESLNLTSAQLYQLPKPQLPQGEISLMFTPRCGPSENAYTQVNGVIACYHYLLNLGSRRCEVPSGRARREMCRSGYAKVSGQAITANSQSSACRDVARGLLWVIDSCTRRDQSVAGHNAAYNNGNLIVGGTHIQW